MAGDQGSSARTTNVANMISLSRLVLLAICVLLLYSGRPALLWAAVVLMFVILIMDSIDGIVARRRGETSVLGSVLDIAIDRVVENVYWISFVGLRLIPVWVALVVVTRGILTDAVRGFVLSKGETPFQMMHTRWGRAIVASRFMRGFYGFAKTVSFGAVMSLYALRSSWVGPTAETWLPRLDEYVLAWVVLTISITVLRGLPVLIEARRYF